MWKRIFVTFIENIHAITGRTCKDCFFSITLFIAIYRIFNTLIKSFDKNSKLSNIDINPFVLIESGLFGDHYNFAYNYTGVGNQRAPGFDKDFR